MCCSGGTGEDDSGMGKGTTIYRRKNLAMMVHSSGLNLFS